MLLTLVALFGAGLASFAAPCVLPLVPVYLGLLTGELASGRPGGALRGTALFVAGFGLVFVAVGAAAGAVSGLLDDGRGVVVRLGGALIVVFGLVMGGWGGRRTQGTRRLPLVLPTGAVVRPLVLGLVFGVAWTPCVGPLLGTALVAAVGTGNGWRGAGALGAYAAGLGAPFLAVAAGLGQAQALQRSLRRAAPTLSRVGAVFLVLVGTAALVGRLPDLLALRV